MSKVHCPGCGSSEVVQRRVNERLRAADPVGRAFELALQIPIWRCNTCKLCWRGLEAKSAIEFAYQRALATTGPSQPIA
jgi:uncharacterized Zn finger protein